MTNEEWIKQLQQKEFIKVIVKHCCYFCIYTPETCIGIQKTCEELISEWLNLEHKNETNTETD